MRLRCIICVYTFEVYSYRREGDTLSIKPNNLNINISIDQYRDMILCCFLITICHSSSLDDLDEVWPHIFCTQWSGK